MNKVTPIVIKTTRTMMIMMINQELPLFCIGFSQTFVFVLSTLVVGHSVTHVVSSK